MERFYKWVIPDAAFVGFGANGTSLSKRELLRRNSAIERSPRPLPKPLDNTENHRQRWSSPGVAACVIAGLGIALTFAAPAFLPQSPGLVTLEVTCIQPSGRNYADVKIRIRDIPRREKEAIIGTALVVWNSVIDVPKLEETFRKGKSIPTELSTQLPRDIPPGLKVSVRAEFRDELSVSESQKRGLDPKTGLSSVGEVIAAGSITFSCPQTTTPVKS